LIQVESSGDSLGNEVAFQLLKNLAKLSRGSSMSNFSMIAIPMSGIEGVGKYLSPPLFMPGGYDGVIP
jgi:hypothetical protein